MAKILIVDDDDQTAQQLASELKNAGHQCAIRNDGTEVLKIAEKSDIDLLLLDVMLPGTSGFEICRQIRRDKKAYMLPIIFVSSMSDEAEIEHGLAQGADGYITKPIDVQAFLQHVDRILRMSYDTDYVNAVTGLPNNEGTHRLVQQQIARDEAFALIYVELLHLKELFAVKDATGSHKALRYLTRAFRHCAENMGFEDYTFGHIGGGHFIGILPTDSAEKFCKNVLKSWRRHMKRFYNSANLKISYSDARAKAKVLDLIMCVTFRVVGDQVTAQDILDTVSRIHQTSYNKGQAGIHIDRRVL
jgi:DNA-binding response OmpR family regulator